MTREELLSQIGALVDDYVAGGVSEPPVEEPTQNTALGTNEWMTVGQGGEVRGVSAEFDSLVNRLAPGETLYLGPGRYGAAGTAVLNVPGARIVGVEGTLIQCTDLAATALTLSGKVPKCDDIYIAALEFVGKCKTAIRSENYTRKVVLESITATEAEAGLVMVDSRNTYYGYGPSEDLFLNACNFGGNGKWGAFIHAAGLEIVDCGFDGGGVGHALRISYAFDSVIRDSAFFGAGPAHHALKLHGPSETQTGALAGRHTASVDISGCEFVGGSNPWTVTVGPQSSSADERLLVINMQDNVFKSGSGTQLDVLFSASNSDLDRNQWSPKGYRVAARGIEPAPTDVVVDGVKVA